MYKKRHFTNPDLRLLDQEVIALKQRVEDLEKTVAARAAVRYSEPGVRIDSRAVADMVMGEAFDRAALEAVQEVSEELQPDTYYVQPEGRGWYTVRSGADGEPTHKGKLRKPAAGKLVADLLEARKAANA